MLQDKCSSKWFLENMADAKLKQRRMMESRMSAYDVGMYIEGIVSSGNDGLALLRELRV